MHSDAIAMLIRSLMPTIHLFVSARNNTVADMKITRSSKVNKNKAFDIIQNDSGKLNLFIVID